VLVSGVVVVVGEQPTATRGDTIGTRDGSDVMVEAAARMIGTSLAAVVVVGKGKIVLGIAWLYWF